MTHQRLQSHPDIKLPEFKQKISFSFNGRSLKGYLGDTISSALFANNIKVWSRSFKYHRPRGIFDGYGHGPETLVTVNRAPNVLADRTLIEEGMEVESQNAWPSPNFDLMGINDTLVPLLPNGFYYKMFHKPKSAWPIFEKFIRKAAGLGKIDREGTAVQTRYEKRYRFPDICIIGGGVSGLSAARKALTENQKVLLLEEQPQLGGKSRYSIHMDPLFNRKESDLVIELIEEIKSHPNLEILCKTTVFALYEDNLVAAQQENDLFKIRAKKVLVCSGATERFQVFDRNDIPGIVTGRCVEKLIAGHGICPGQNVVIIANHDRSYSIALSLKGAGAEVTLVDSRVSPNDPRLLERCQAHKIKIYFNRTVHRALGKKWITGVDCGGLDGISDKIQMACDLLVLSVGYKPQLNLLSMGRKKPIWDEKHQVLRVEQFEKGLYAAGEVWGPAHYSTLVKESEEIVQQAIRGEPQNSPIRASEEVIKALPADINSGGQDHFICKCMDVTRKEALCSIQEGFDQIESLKRYTSMGMGPCQGKSCHEAVARLAAEDTPSEESAVPTTMRPPFYPVSLGVLAGRAVHLQPIKRTPMHACHEKLGATFLDAGQWKRPEYYTNPEEEAEHVRKYCGLIDVSTLGKLEISGSDAIALIHFLFPGKFAKLAVGKTRYAIMVGEDGILFEDGTISHIEEGKYYISTTTGNQDAIVSRIWWWLTTEKYQVYFKNLSQSYAAVNVAGQSSREFLQKHTSIDLSNDAFPYMACRSAELFGVPVWMFRIGFTGELGYEIHYPSEYGESLWEKLLESGQEVKLKPFGVEAQRILRLEKGHLIPGVDTDALSNPYEAGVGFAVKDDKKDFVGKSFLAHFKERKQENVLVPYRLKVDSPLPDDGVVLLDSEKIIGRVTSSRMSPALGHGIGLAWIRADQSKTGTQFKIRLSNGNDVEAEVLDHAAFDPEGLRMKA